MHLQCFAQIDIDIGTKFLYFQCFFTTDMFLFCKTILYSGNCRIFRDLAFGSIKTRFKAILKKLDFSAQIDFLMNFCPRRATKLRRFTQNYKLNNDKHITNANMLSDTQQQRIVRESNILKSY